MYQNLLGYHILIFLFNRQYQHYQILTKCLILPRLLFIVV